MRSRIVVFLFAGVLSTVSQAADSTVSTGWPQWRGPDRDGTVAEESWPDGLQGHLETRWEIELDPSYSGPLVVDDRVITTATVDRKDERVTVLDRTSGEVVWQRQWPGSMSVPFFAAKNGDWIRATPVSDGTFLVVPGMRDVLKCFRLDDGEEVWSNDYPAEAGTSLPSFGLVSSPLIDDKAVYAQAGGGVRRIELETGETQWVALTEQGGMSGGAFSSPIVATISGKRQLVVQTRQALCGVELDTGNVLWSQQIEAFRGMNILTPLVIGDRVFTSAYGGRSLMIEVTQTSEGEWSTQIAWENKAQAYMSSPVVIDGYLYMHLRNRRVVCVDVQSGETAWTSQPQKEYWSLIASGETILALDNEGSLILMKANPQEFKVVEEYRVAEDSWAHLAVAGQTIVVRDLNKLTLYNWR